MRPRGRGHGKSRASRRSVRLSEAPESSEERCRCAYWPGIQRRPLDCAGPGPVGGFSWRRRRLALRRTPARRRRRALRRPRVGHLELGERVAHRPQLLGVARLEHRQQRAHRLDRRRDLLGVALVLGAAGQARRRPPRLMRVTTVWSSTSSTCDPAQLLLERRAQLLLGRLSRGWLLAHARSTASRDGAYGLARLAHGRGVDLLERRRPASSSRRWRWAPLQLAAAPARCPSSARTGAVQASSRSAARRAPGTPRRARGRSGCRPARSGSRARCSPR